MSKVTVGWDRRDLVFFSFGSNHQCRFSLNRCVLIQIREKDRIDDAPAVKDNQKERERETLT